MKKFITLALCAIIALSFTACSDKTNTNDNQSEKTGEENQQIPNPFIDCETINDASKIAGFTITVPEKMPEGYVQDSIEAVENEILQIFYVNGDKTILIRKARGNEDISGDYNTYSENNTITIGNLNVSTKGNDGKVNVATWVNGEFTYAIIVNSGEVGLDSTTIRDMIIDIQ